MRDSFRLASTLHLMAKIRLHAGQPVEALTHVQEAVTIFRETDSRHLPEAEATLQKIYSMIKSGGQSV
jgi:hypothetical protein